MTEKDYRRPLSWWKKQQLRTNRTLENGNMIVPAYHRVKVTGKMKGLDIVSDGCHTCGVKIRMTRVPFTALELCPGEDDESLEQWAMMEANCHA